MVFDHNTARISRVSNARELRLLLLAIIDMGMEFISLFPQSHLQSMGLPLWFSQLQGYTLHLFLALLTDLF